ncbi:MAG TPA: hypothetical protein VJL37_06110 [Flavobacterium sp.]|nr:hypothetical protein [Flavobacterium sp.]
MEYSFKIWFFTTLLSPILILVSGFLIHYENWHDIAESIPLLLVMILIGSVLSLPAMLLFYLIQYKLRNIVTNTKAKLFLSAYSFASVWVTFYIVDHGFVERGSKQLVIVLLYSLTIVIGVWIFKLSETKEAAIH